MAQPVPTKSTKADRYPPLLTLECRAHNLETGMFDGAETLRRDKAARDAAKWLWAIVIKRRLQ